MSVFSSISTGRLKGVAGFNSKGTIHAVIRLLACFGTYYVGQSIKKRHRLIAQINVEMVHTHSCILYFVVSCAMID